MPMKLRAAGAWRDIVGMKLYQTGAWRTIRKGLVYSGGAWREFGVFVDALSASASPASLDAPAPGMLTATSGDCTVTPSGGLSPYTYAWALVSDTATNTPTILSPASAVTQFQLVLASQSEVATAVFRCTVTDSLGATAVTNDVTVTFAYVDFSTGTG